jgi:hypothetical protein
MQSFSITPISQLFAEFRCVLWLALLILETQQYRQQCSVSGNTSAIMSVAESRCPTSNFRFYRISVTSPGADQVYTSILSPVNATCLGLGAEYVCSANPDNMVVYSVYSAFSCLPDDQNNNFADTSARFSKQIVICSPCPPGDYWLALRPLSANMTCSYKLFIPFLE